MAFWNLCVKRSVQYRYSSVSSIGYLCASLSGHIRWVTGYWVDGGGRAPLTWPGRLLVRCSRIGSASPWQQLLVFPEWRHLPAALRRGCATGTPKQTQLPPQQKNYFEIGFASPASFFRLFFSFAMAECSGTLPNGRDR